MTEKQTFEDWLDGFIRGMTGASDSAGWPRTLTLALCKELKSAETTSGIKHEGSTS